MTLDFSDGNWIPLFRPIRRHWVWQDKPFATGQAWIDLCMRANHQETKFPFRSFPPLIVRPRQVVATVQGLAEDWGRDRKWVRSVLKRFQADDMLKIEFRSWCPRTGTWTDRKTDSGIMLLIVVNLPIKGLPKNDGTAKRTGNGPAKGQETDSNGTGPGHIQEGEEGEEQEEPEDGEESGGGPPPDMLARLAGLFDWIPGERGKMTAIKTMLAEGAESLVERGVDKSIAPVVMRRAIFQVSLDGEGKLFELLRRARDEFEELEDGFYQYAAEAYQEGRRKMILDRGSVFCCDDCRADLRAVADLFPDPKNTFETLERRVQSGEVNVGNVWCAASRLLRKTPSMNLDDLTREALEEQRFEDVQNADDEIEFGRRMPVLGDWCGRGSPRRDAESRTALVG